MQESQSGSTFAADVARNDPSDQGTPGCDLDVITENIQEGYRK